MSAVDISLPQNLRSNGEEEEDEEDNVAAAPPMPSSSGGSLASASRCTSQMEEDEDYPKTLQEELNEILEAWYALISEEDIVQYQKFLEDVTGKKVAEGAVQEVGEIAPDFELPDQDEEVTHLDQLCQSGPVVLIFYRGKWCPWCNTHIRALQGIVDCVKERGGSIVAVSPMLPDGTQYMASKWQLGYRVCSDVGNVVTKAYRLAFPVHPDVRQDFLNWSEDVPAVNGDFTWEIPVPATYILGQDRRILWSFIDNDCGVRADPKDILAHLPSNKSETTLAEASKRDVKAQAASNGVATQNLASAEEVVEKVVDKNNSGRGNAFRMMKKKCRKVFGKKKQEPMDYLMTKFGM